MAKRLIVANYGSLNGPHLKPSVILTVFTAGVSAFVIYRLIQSAYFET